MRKIILSLAFILAVPLLCQANVDPKTKSKVEKYWQKVKAQPDWLVSRLQMYWYSHAMKVYIDGEQFHHAGGEKAPVPTVRLCGTRTNGGSYNRPSLEEVMPYDDDADSRVTYINKDTGKQEKVHPSKTGSSIASVNREILGIARDAALVYQENGDTCLARMAYDVFDCYMRGIYYRSMPIDMRHGGTQNIVGITTFEVIHEDAVKETTALYTLLKKYIAQKGLPKIFDLYDEVFKKWAQVIIDNGVPNNNWNLIQAELISKIAMVLHDDNAYADHHGKQYYQNYIVNISSPRQWALSRLASYGFDKNTNIWNESPGYSVNVVNEFAELANKLDRDAEINLYDSIPCLSKAVLASAQYLMPNRMISGFGDTHPNYLNRTGAESVMEYAKRKNLPSLYQQYKAFSEALLPSASAKDIERYVSPSFYSPNVSWLAMRSGMDARHDLMASLNGSLGNHQHANGISLELYGKGYVLAPDGGIGGNLYSGSDYKDYYSQFPAHNTVCVNGKSSYRVMLSEHPFTLIDRYPSSNDIGGFCNENDNDTCQLCRSTFATVAFTEPATNASQQRTVGIVKTSDKGGYYVDVFRSKQAEADGNQYHDYFYHNLGQEMTIMDGKGKRLALKPFEDFKELSPTSFSQEGILKAYSWIKDKKATAYKEDVTASFITNCRDGRRIQMKMWMKGEQGRKIIQALSPRNMEYERLGERMPYDIISQPVLTFIARQIGEAWNRPFVSIYEPSDNEEPSEIEKVSFFRPKSDDSSAIGIRVVLKNGRTDYIFSASRKTKMTYKGMTVEGIYKVISNK